MPTRLQNHESLTVACVRRCDNGLIRIDLRGGELPGEGGAELEDLQGFISNGALEAARPIVATGTKFFYNGREFDEQYPGLRRATVARNPRRKGWLAYEDGGVGAFATAWPSRTP
jgi:hypothetical protein